MSPMTRFGRHGVGELRRFASSLLVEAGIAPDRATALRHLLRSHDGAALLH
jgi:hypothetical protein